MHVIHMTLNLAADLLQVSNSAVGEFSPAQLLLLSMLPEQQQSSYLPCWYTCVSML